MIAGPTSFTLDDDPSGGCYTSVTYPGSYARWPVAGVAGAQLPDPGGRQAASRILEGEVGQQPLPGGQIVFATAGRQPRPQRLLIAEAHHRLAHPALERLTLMNHPGSLGTRQQRPQVAHRRLPDVAAVQQTAYLGDIA